MKKRGKLLSFLVRLKFSSEMAISGLISNLMRTFLTLLGIAIGVAAVVSLMGIGEGARQAVVSQFESLGQNVVVIKSNNPSITFDLDESEELIDRVQGLDYATPVVKTEGKIRWRRTKGELDILGVNDKFPIIRDHNLISGNFFTSLHVKQRSPVVVLGYNVGKTLLNGRSPVGQTISIEGITYRILGVLEEKGAGKAEDIDDKIVLPYTTSLKITRKNTVDEMWGKSDSPENASLAIVQLGRIYKRKLGLVKTFKPATDENSGESGMKPNGMDNKMSIKEEKVKPVEPEEPVENMLNDGEDVITITNLNQLVEEADQANRIMTLLLGGIAAVSLLVGGLGIMNIMLVAVSERTSEIGVRRALGAKQEDLLIQFLLEALYVSIFGCLFGVLLGAWGVGLVSSYGLEAVVSIQSIKIAAVVAISSGLLFGVYPAISASSLPPVEALRR